MTYTFDITQLDILNTIISDASVDNEQFKKLAGSDTEIEFIIERREFENVERKNILHWTVTYFAEKKSVLRFTGVRKCSVTGSENTGKGKNQLTGVTKDHSKQVIITTAFGLTITLLAGINFRAILTDLEESSSGKGICLGARGHTSTEWINYLQGRNYKL
jgi:hypothetical protein